MDNTKENAVAAPSKQINRNSQPAPAVDIIENLIGAFGRYQLWICFLIFLCKFPVAYHQMAILFLAPKVAYTCPDTNKTSCPCDNPKYDTSIFSNTIIMEWNLICGNRFLVSTTQMMFQLGTLIGSIVFGMASDRFGRKLPLCISMVIQVTAGVAAAYMPNYVLFTICRFLVGLSVGGSMVTSFVVIMEFVGAEHRSTISALYQVPFNVGHMMLPLIGYFIRDYKYFQLAISAPAGILVSYFILIPETPRWLIAMKRKEEAVRVLEMVAKRNNLPVENIQRDVDIYQANLEKNNLKKGNITDLFRTPNLRKNILAMSYNWLTCSYCFYGISQYMGQLSGNVFVNVACAASLTLCGTILSIPMLNFFNRKTILMASNFITASCLFVLAVIPEGIASVVCACIGSVGSFVVFVVVYLYCSELFPTVVRNAALGFSSMMARVGSMIAPFVIDTKQSARWLPPLLFAIVPFIAGFVTILLPETKNCALLTTIEEGESFGKKNKPDEESKKS